MWNSVNIGFFDFFDIFPVRSISSSPARTKTNNNSTTKEPQLKGILKKTHPVQGSKIQPHQLNRVSQTQYSYYSTHYPVHQTSNQIQYPEHSLQHRQQSIQYPEHSLQHREQLIQYPEQPIQYPGQSIQYPGQSIQYPGQSIQYPGQSFQNHGHSFESHGKQIQHPDQSNQYPALTGQTSKCYQKKYFSFCFYCNQDNNLDVKSKHEPMTSPDYENLIQHQDAGYSPNFDQGARVQDSCSPTKKGHNKHQHLEDRKQQYCKQQHVPQQQHQNQEGQQEEIFHHRKQLQCHGLQHGVLREPKQQHAVLREPIQKLHQQVHPPHQQWQEQRYQGSKQQLQHQEHEGVEAKVVGSNQKSYRSNAAQGPIL